MSAPTKIKVFLDETVAKNAFFKKPTFIKINNIELFKYAVFMMEVPGHIVESDFEYLQSKVPGLESTYSDYIKYTKDTIINLSKDDRIKKFISEAVGVAVGLKYSAELLKISPSKFKKTDVPIAGKYMDYSAISNSREYEIETKGTVSSNYNRAKQDILDKKANKNNKVVHLKYGTIMMLKNQDANGVSKCVIVDDPPIEKNIESDDSFKTQLQSYGLFLSYIFDSRYFNRYINVLTKNRLRRIKINKKKFFCKYVYEGKTFYGECFDHRLIEDNFRPLAESKPSMKILFSEITKKVGKTKIFIGVHSRVIDYINEREIDSLKTYKIERSYFYEKELDKFLDEDGILVVKSKNGKDAQIEQIFSEEEVERRLGLHASYLRGEAHRCGAPCRSKDIEGKPCEIMTFRSHCHFHR